MKYAAIFACLFAVALAQTTTPTTTTTVTTTTTTTTPPTTTTTTTPPTTTTTTTPPTTTTPKPTTTTPVPPTPKPTPDPVNPPKPGKLEAGNWNVTKDNKTICLKAHFAAEIIVPYTASTGVVHNATIAVPSTAIATGTCDSLLLVWPTSNMTTGNNALFFNFTTGTIGNDTKKMYMPSTIFAVLRNDPYFFPNATEASFSAGAFSVYLNGSTDFTAPVNNSFRCYSERVLEANMTMPFVTNHTGYFLFKDVQIEPLMPADTTGFGAAITCDLDRGLTSDIVPIAVGCALAGLVVVVIIAYIIGRRRSRQSGYTSV